MDYSKYPQTQGIVLTSWKMVWWMLQCMVAGAPKVCRHCDAKFKLHHGEWVLTSLGTHCLRWDPHNLKLSTTFVPLVYLMCKQHESAGAALLPMDALNVTTLKYFDGKLVPGACMSDYCVSFRTAYDKTWPGTQFGTCWPHIIRKWCEGEYASKKWRHFEVLNL